MEFCHDKMSDRMVVWTGIGLILSLGLILGLTIDTNTNIPEPFNRLSSILGWIYFICWSISFYPQVYENWSRQSVVGLSFDFEVYNLLGFGCYSIFNCAFFWSSYVQTQYRKRFHGHSNVVEPNDVFFALHAVVITLFTLYQCFSYDRGTQSISKTCIAVSSLCVSFASVFFFLTLILHDANNELFNILNALYVFSYIKLLISLIKYIPQVRLNYARKSTVGWNIWNVLLDFTGGTLSIAQLCLDCFALHDWTGITGDPVKFALGFVSIVFDIIFVTQHYLLYPHDDVRRERPEAVSPENEPLLYHS